MYRSYVGNTALRGLHEEDLCAGGVGAPSERHTDADMSAERHFSGAGQCGGHSSGEGHDSGAARQRALACPYGEGHGEGCPAGHDSENCGGRCVGQGIIAWSARESRADGGMDSDGNIGVVVVPTDGESVDTGRIKELMG